MKRLEMVWNLLERLGAAVAALGFAICLSFGFVSCLTPDGMLVGPHPADGTSLPYDSLLAVASAYADSVYFANVDGDHEQAVVFADSAVAHLNRYAAQHAPTLRPLAVSGKGDVPGSQDRHADRTIAITANKANHVRLTYDGAGTLHITGTSTLQGLVMANSLNANTRLLVDRLHDLGRAFRRSRRRHHGALVGADVRRRV